MNINTFLKLSLLASPFASTPVTHLQYFVARTVLCLHIHAVGYIDALQKQADVERQKVVT